MSLPSVAVVIPVFNRVNLIQEAVDSVIDESGVEVEVVLVDDGSTDGSADAVHAIAAAHPRVIAVVQPNRGPSAARNAGVAASRARFVTFLDSDDLSLSGRLALQYRYWNTRGAERPVIVGREQVRFVDGVEPPAHMLNRLATDENVYQTSMFLEREVFDSVGGFDEEMRLGEDVAILAELGYAGFPVVIIDDVVLTRRAFGDNLVYGADNQRDMLNLVRRHLARRRAEGARADSSRS